MTAMAYVGGRTEKNPQYRSPNVPARHAICTTLSLTHALPSAHEQRPAEQAGRQAGRQKGRRAGRQTGGRPYLAASSRGSSLAASARASWRTISWQCSAVEMMRHTTCGQDVQPAGHASLAMPIRGHARCSRQGQTLCTAAPLPSPAVSWNPPGNPLTQLLSPQCRHRSAGRANHWCPAPQRQQGCRMRAWAGGPQGGMRMHGTHAAWGGRHGARGGRLRQSRHRL